MKIALDLDGVAFEYVKFFKEFAWVFKTFGHHVGILTGRIEEDYKKEDLFTLESCGFPEFDFYIGRKRDEKLIGEFKRKAIIENNIDVLIDDFGSNNSDIENTFFEEKLPEGFLILKVLNRRKYV